MYIYMTLMRPIFGSAERRGGGGLPSQWSSGATSSRLSSLFLRPPGRVCILLMYADHFWFAFLSLPCARHRVAGRASLRRHPLRAEGLHEHGANRSVPVDFDAVRLGNAGMQPQVANGGLCLCRDVCPNRFGVFLSSGVASSSIPGGSRVETDD